MLKKLLEPLKVTPAELVSQGVLTTQAFEQLNKFYQRIENTLNELSYAHQREFYAYDFIINHSKKVAFYAITLARRARITPQECSETGLAAVLHDLDKLYWPVQLLDKSKDELTKEDYTRIIEHPLATAIFVERLTKYQISPNIITIIKQHHENLDGSGYPNHISGQNICLGARIIRLTDSYESMISSRVYKKEVLTNEEALNDLKSKVGQIYDPNIIKWFEEIFPTIQ